MRLQQAWNRLFVRRELFIREAKGTRRIVFEKGTQIQLGIIGLGLLLWVAYATSSMVMGKASTRIMQERLAETHNAYEQRITTMQQEYEDLHLRIILTEKEFTRLAKEMTQRHKHLADLIAMQARIGVVMKKRKAVKNKTKYKKRKRNNRSELNPLREQDSVVLTSRPAGPFYQFFPAYQLYDRKQLSKNMGNRLSKGVLHTGNKHIDKMAKLIMSYDRQQRALLDHLDEKTSHYLNVYQRAISITEAVEANVFADRVTREKKQRKSYVRYPIKRNIGGPVIAITAPPSKKIDKKVKPMIEIISDDNGIENQARVQINKLYEKIEKLKQFDLVMEQIPFAHPMLDYHRTSAFGPRIDPFTREWAFHTGVDIAGSKDYRVQATLPGRVIFAGKARGYGNMIEVIHRFGLKTRYGHLKKIYVKKGDKVGFNKTLALMGNSGRSTGDHLHYEILIDDKPYDPWKFLEAGEYVFQTVQ